VAMTRSASQCVDFVCSEQGFGMASIQAQPLRCSGGKEDAWFRHYRRSGNRAVRNALVERYTPLALNLARRYRSGSEREDVTQVALLALVKAVDRFDPEKGVAFSSFATPTILGEIKRYFRDCGWAVRMPRGLQALTLRLERAGEELTARLGRSPTVAELADALGVAAERVVEAQATSTAHRPVALDAEVRQGETERHELVAVQEQGFARVEDACMVDSLLGRLSQRDRVVIELSFRHDLLQREIAALLGISQMQVSRVLSRSTASLREDHQGLNDAAQRRPGLASPEPASREAAWI
jgi:RNA polymerase sigma-B factor